MDDQALLEEVKRRLSGLAGVVKLVAFGSRARGGAREGSDLDLMVVLDHPGLGDRSLYVRRQLRGLGVPVDLIIYSPRRYEELRRFGSTIAGIADRQGLVLVG